MGLEAVAGCDGHHALTLLYLVGGDNAAACGVLESAARRRCWNIRVNLRGPPPPRHRRAGQSLPTAGYRRYY